MCGDTPSLTTKTKKFATMDNRRNGTTVMIVAYSSVACAKPPTPNSTTCQKISVGGVSVDPSTWAPAFLVLEDGMEQYSWLFSICNSNPTPPSWASTCSPNGNVVEYNGDQCAGVAFNKLSSFSFERGIVHTTYVSAASSSVIATLHINCLPGAAALTSLDGTYTITNTSRGVVFDFNLGIQDLCSGTMGPSGMPSFTFPTGSQQSSMLPTGSQQSSVMPTGSQSSMPVMPTGSQSSMPVPSGSQSSMPVIPTGSQSSMPAVPTGSQSSMPVPSGSESSQPPMPSAQ
jgi:hypothetical protein